MVKHMSVEPINKENAVGTSVDMTDLNGSAGALTPASPGWLGKDNPNYLLNLFTVLLLASALIIMVVVGAAIDRIYSAAMVKNAQESAISVVNLLMNTELDNLIKPGPDGQLTLVVDPSDMQRLNLQMHRHLKPFSMHKIKMYTPDKKIIYSTDATLIGKIDKDNQILDRVMTSGQPVSELQRKKVFVDLGGGKIEDASIVEAYAPTFDSNRQLLGVFEVYVDITKTRQEIVHVLTLTMIALAAVLSVCLFSLYVLMKRGTLGLIKAHQELKELATKDYLTGAYNRRYINERIKEEFYRMRRQPRAEQIEKSIGFVMADVDHFKKINDNHGHMAGDQVLREVSRRLKQGLRDYDVLCRYGGEEFLIMLPHTGELESMDVAQRLRQSVISLPFTIEGIDPVVVTMSFGVATSNSVIEPEQAVIARADQALYQAKNGGRNQVVLNGTEPRFA